MKDPVLGKSPDEEIVAFIRKYVRNPDENVSPTMYEMNGYK